MTDAIEMGVSKIFVDPCIPVQTNDGIKVKHAHAAEA